jgi:ATP-binding cassette subfamily F protein uup
VLEGDGRVQDFVGGYSDWERWRDARDKARVENSRQRASSASPPPRQDAAPLAPAPARRKLSYKDQRELDALPGKLEQLEQRKATLTAETGDASFYSRPHAEVAARLQELASLEAEIEAAFTRWAELEGA